MRRLTYMIWPDYYSGCKITSDLRHDAIGAVEICGQAAANYIVPSSHNLAALIWLNYGYMEKHF